MCFLHKQKPPVIHGGLKSRNILIGKGFRAKISDCGQAHTSTSTVLSYSTAYDVSRSVAYIAPEFLTDPRKEKNKEYDIKCHILL